ncbi:MAG TPA: acetyl-CoA decarbonylase/synthase complex subunit alpha/beta [Armatimonadota bacterium]|jgi:acetyl-CoA synthase
MSKLIASSAIKGAHKIVNDAEAMVRKAIAEKGADCAVGFPDTTYYLPVIYSLLGKKVETLADMEDVLQECRSLLPPVPRDGVWLPYLGGTLDSGMATLFAFELIEACKYLIGPNPVEGIWLGAAGDVIIRERGIEFVDGSAPGFAAVVGAAPDKETAVKIARELQEKNLYIFLAGNTNGVTFAEQLEEAGVELGWDTRLVPFGKDISAAIYALGFANRAALSFGGVKPGDYAANLKYNKNRIFAFVMALGEVSEEDYAAAAGAISYGFPTIADSDIPEILPTGICTYEHVVSNITHDRIVEKCLEVRGCKIKITKVPIPVSYGAAFEGERIRKEQTFVEFGGNKTHGFEYVTTKDIADVEDGKMTVIGPDVDDVEPGSALPLAIWVEVAGRKMQPDFEPILERQIHHLINGAEGIWHMGQRDIIWMRISKAAKDKGFTIKHFGEILHAKLLNEYPAIVDKVQVTLITDKDEVEKRLVEARRVYRERNLRLESMTDESVDTFYSCLLCQSFAPNHVCVITPERLGLCGAYNWLDGKAAYEIDPTGPNQPLTKGECIDPVRGQWADINDYVYSTSKQSIERFNAYSMLEDPMTSCGCFEAIVALLPECNGVMIVNREFPGETPAGMKFSTLAGTTGGGQQTPGFIGVGKAYITSKKFIAAEGGHKRIVWMPRELKETLKDDLELIGKRLGIENYADLIADESVGSDTASITAYMEKVGHPALTMWEITSPSPEAAAVDAARGVASTAPAPAPVAAAPAQKTPEVVTAPEPVAPTPQPVATQPTTAPIPVATGASADGLSYVISVLDKVRASGLPQTGTTPEQQMAALQMSTAVNLLTAGANMLLMYSGALGQVPVAPVAVAIAAGTAPAATPVPGVHPITATWETPAAVKSKPVTSAKIVVPSTFTVPGESTSLSVREVTLGGCGTRTSSLTLGGASVLPFRHYEGNTGRQAAIAMEVFDLLPRNYPQSLRDAYGDLLTDAPKMAKYCVEELGAQAISIRLDGTHPDNGDKSPEAACDFIQDVLKAVGVPIIVTGPSNYVKNNAVMKQVASTFAGENLLLNWVETDNYKTIAAAAMAYNHCVVTQTPIDVNMAKQLNILVTNMGLAPEKIIIDALTGALGYGLEYTYSVMERIRSAVFTGDSMLALPIMATPGYEVAKTKESKAPQSAFKLWGPESERGALLEIATAMSLLNAGADLLVMYHPVAARTVKQKIAEMTRLED